MPVGDDAVMVSGAALTVNVSMTSFAGPTDPAPACDARKRHSPTPRSVTVAPELEDEGTVQIDVVRLTTVTGVKL
jgi:hypothetical protein